MEESLEDEESPRLLLVVLGCEIVGLESLENEWSVVPEAEAEGLQNS